MSDICKPADGIQDVPWSTILHRNSDADARVDSWYFEHSMSRMGRRFALLVMTVFALLHLIISLYFHRHGISCGIDVYFAVYLPAETSEIANIRVSNENENQYEQITNPERYFHQGAPLMGNLEMSFRLNTRSTTLRSQIREGVVDVQAVTEVIERVLGSSLAKGFRVEQIPFISGNESSIFEITTMSEPRMLVMLRGTNTLAVTSALHYYMTHFMNASISWTGDSIPKQPLCQSNHTDECYTLPVVHSPVRRTRRIPISYYMNTCTYSYTMAWWDWARWEKEIDWMALKGINLPLAFTGQEYIWRRVFRRHFGVTDADLSDWFSGPAFLAWFRMGNLQKWAGPLPLDWMYDQHLLQLKILQRMTLLGMTPVLPAFAGHVPQSLPKYVPTTKFFRTDAWAGFNDTYARTTFVDINDPLYKQLGGLFIREQAKIYGNISNVYNADQYNELTPASLELPYLRQAGVAQLESLKAGNPDAHWLMQGWLFGFAADIWTPDRVQAYLSGVASNEMTVLDLYSEAVPVWQKLKMYFGKSFVWNMLHNFGANTDMKGMLDTVLIAPEQTKSIAGDLMIGIGIAPEGLNQNIVLYDAVLDFAWREQATPNPQQWLKQWVVSRYSANNRQLQEAWTILHQTIYSCQPSHEVCQTNRAHYLSIIEKAPGPDLYLGFFYNLRALQKAWKTLLTASEMDNSLLHSETYKSDVVNVGRQVLSDSFRTEYIGLTRASNSSQLPLNKKLYLVRSHRKAMQSLILDLNRLLSTDRQCLLGTWLSQAVATGGTKQNGLLNFNARNQVTMWGPVGNIMDYAGKVWAGLITDYYWPRWATYIDYLEVSIETGRPFDVQGYQNERFAHEKGWQTQEKKYTSTPQGDATEIARLIYDVHYERMA
eukprot:CFRG6608T1